MTRKRKLEKYRNAQRWAKMIQKFSSELHRLYLTIL